jgi:type VI secretion system VasD/TssJ family lipoprotein
MRRVIVKSAPVRAWFDGFARLSRARNDGLGLLVVMALAGCAAPPPPPPVLTLNIIGSAAQNPDPAGHGTTVAVKFYQLSSTGKFQSADVYTLMGNEAAALGTDEAAPSAQFLLAPGASLTETVPLKPLVSSVGFAVLFRDINQSTWKLTAPVAANGPSAVTLRVNGLTAAIDKPQPGGS